MYTEQNFKSKKALKNAVENGEKIAIFQPGPFGGIPKSGTICLEGPHFPQPHTWYATVEMENGFITVVK